MTVFSGSIVCSVTMTIVSYIISVHFFRKYKKSWLNPLYTSSALVISLLFLFHVPVSTYQKGSLISCFGEKKKVHWDASLWSPQLFSSRS